MITEITVYDVKELNIESSRVDAPAENCTTVKIHIGVDGVSGQREWQTVTLFFWDREGQPRFEDGVIHRKIAAFNAGWDGGEQKDEPEQGSPDWYRSLRLP